MQEKRLKVHFQSCFFAYLLHWANVLSGELAYILYADCFVNLFFWELQRYKVFRIFANI